MGKSISSRRDFLRTTGVVATSIILPRQVVDAEEGVADPNHHVVGAKPGMDTPWYINVGRTRVRSAGKTTWAFPHTGKRSYHVPERFAKMVIE
jgi:hypothetical protein